MMGPKESLINFETFYGFKKKLYGNNTMAEVVLWSDQHFLLNRLNVCFNNCFHLTSISWLITVDPSHSHINFTNFSNKIVRCHVIISLSIYCNCTNIAFIQKLEIDNIFLLDPTPCCDS